MLCKKKKKKSKKHKKDAYIATLFAVILWKNRKDSFNTKQVTEVQVSLIPKNNDKNIKQLWQCVIFYIIQF